MGDIVNGAVGPLAPPPDALGVPAVPSNPDLLASDPDDSEDGSNSGHSGRPQVPAQPLRPTLDRASVGYVVCIDCGHNGVLSEGEQQHLALHLRAARFGKYSEDGGRHVSSTSGVV